MEQLHSQYERTTDTPQNTYFTAFDQTKTIANINQNLSKIIIANMSTIPTQDMKNPAYLDEIVLNYLRLREREGQQNEDDQPSSKRSYGYSYGAQKSSSSDHHGGSHVKSILNDLLNAIERRGRFKNEYMKRLHEHNQFDLFDLATVLPDFYIGDYCDFLFNFFYYNNSYRCCI